MQKAVRSNLLGISLALVALALVCWGLYRAAGVTGNGGNAASNRPFVVGYVRTPLLAPVFVALQEGTISTKHTKHFDSGSEIGYGLISGDLDAGFVEAAKARNLLSLSRSRGVGLSAVGSIEFPYGATLIIRKDLDIRLNDLNGRTIAAGSPSCRMLHQFTADAKRLEVDLSRSKLIYMSFDDMLPALEARRIDAAVVKGAHAILAESEDHMVLYQNWDVQAGDECCPATLSQTEFLLIVRSERVKDAAALVSLLEQASKKTDPDVTLKATAKMTGFPEEKLERYPIATFAPVSAEWSRILGI